MKKFKYGWLEKRRFSAERKRQSKMNNKRYDQISNEDAETYWLQTETPSLDLSQKEVLTSFCKALVNRE